MGQAKQARDYLIKKIEMIKKIAANTETQHRFIHKREMKGLGRVLGERDVLLAELASLNCELAKDKTWETTSVLAPIIQEVVAEQQAILERSKQVLEEAMAERNRIATELKNKRIHLQVRSHYVNPWAIVASGARFNAKG